MSDLKELNALNHASLYAKATAVLANRTPARPLRPEEEAVLLAQNVAGDERLKAALPFVIEDGTSLLGSSSLVLADGSGNCAVLAVAYVPPSVQGTTAAASNLEAARWMAQRQAHKFIQAKEDVEPSQPGAGDCAIGGQVAVGVVSNVAGLEWVQPPPVTVLAALQQVQAKSRGASAGAKRRRLLRHAATLLAGCATAAAVFVALVSAGS